MTTISSHANLHPQHGARFVADRQSEAPLVYAVTAYLPDAQTLSARLSWEGERAVVTPEWDDGWATEEVLKLARVLKRAAKPHVTRWRARPDESRSP